MVITAVTVTTVKITVYQYFYLLLQQLLFVPYSGCDRNGVKSMITITIQPVYIVLDAERAKPWPRQGPVRALNPNSDTPQAYQ